jgi:hypothetical protein
MMARMVLFDVTRNGNKGRPLPKRARSENSMPWTAFWRANFTAISPHWFPRERLGALLCCLLRSHGGFVMKKATLGLLVGAVLALAGCGTDPGERALSGGLLGAGAGAAIGAATGGNVGTAAVIGGAAGAVGGAATSPCDVDLNAPGGRRDCR